MTIRPAIHKDMTQCEEIAKEPDFEFPGGGTPESEFLTRYIDDPYFLVVEEDNQIIGFALGEPLKNHAATLWYLAVKAKRRNQGIGSKLLEEYERRLKMKGINWIVLNAPLSNERSVNFYKKHGYSQGHSFYEMNKELK